MSNEPILNDLPPVAIGLAAGIVLVEALFAAGGVTAIGGATGIGWRVEAIQDYAFSPVVLERIIERGDASFGLLRRFVTYAAIQQSWLGALFAAAMVLALGNAVGRVLGSVQMILLVVISTMGSALVFGLVLDGPVPLIGAFPAVYGLIGAFTYSLWLRLGEMGKNQLAAFRLIGVLLAIQFLFGLLLGASSTWIAELAGFAIGFAVSPLLVPGGFAALLAKARNRP